MRVDDLNVMAFKVGVICKHMSAHLAYAPNGSLESFRGHQNNAVLQVKMSVNVGMAKLVNLGTEIHLARGERCEGVKKEGCIKKQDTRLNFYITNMIIRKD